MSEQKKQTKAEILTTLAREFSELFHDGDKAYATVSFNQTLPIKSQGYKDILRSAYYSSTNEVPSSEAFQSAINTIEALAKRQGLEIKTFVRLAGDEGCVYIDLCNQDNQVIRISSEGWNVINNSPVKFVRVAGLKPLPVPQSGDFKKLRALLNVVDDAQFSLIVSWLIGAANPYGPYPIIILHGEHGSAKSSAARILKSILDPSELVLRSEPKEPRDLAISAQRNHILSYDNLSSIPGWLSDCFCRLATGGGFGIRQLYTDSDEVIYNARRPLIINSIADVATRSDLLDRSIIVNLPPIEEAKRRTESDLNAQFQELHPKIIGALCAAVSEALRNKENVTLKQLPRMADFTVWITAAEPALDWQEGYFLSCYNRNRKTANELALEANPISASLRRLFENPTTWSGNSAKLLEELNAITPDEIRRDRDWPKTARGLSGVLRRLAPNLRIIGIDIVFERESSANRTRIIHIKSKGLQPSEPTIPSIHDASIADGTNPEPAIQPEQASQLHSLDGFADGTISQPSKVLSFNADELDGMDGHNPSVSVSLVCPKHQALLVASEYGPMCSVCFEEVLPELML